MNNTTSDRISGQKFVLFQNKRPWRMPLSAGVRAAMVFDSEEDAEKVRAGAHEPGLAVVPAEVIVQVPRDCVETTQVRA